MDTPIWLKPEDRPDDSFDDQTVNRVELVGYVGQDPELRFTRNEELVVTFSLATHRLLRNGEGLVTQLTDWHRIVARGEVAGTASQIRKGALVKITGQLRTRSWETRQGEQRIAIEVNAWTLNQVRRAPVFRQVPLPLR
ncbi:MAG: single-stranded DNA-binding protein [Chloroflexota bacterium]